MADYFTNFSLMLPLPSEAAQQTPTVSRSRRSTSIKATRPCPTTSRNP